MLTVDEVARELKVAKMTIFRSLKSGRMKGIKIGNCWRISEDELKRVKKVGM